MPEQWSHYTQINADFFAELGSPGGAAKVGMTENDPQAVKDLAPQSEDA
ncbi:ferredoxin fdxC [Mycobacterium tuberculosis]|nr:ferredoxin fdxC [Mycobacterium tuberculosis]COY72825.1 ferredoxin fdxC [Mycobacterium tuberculosis]CPB54587.1 ferredoxin fdxC [Mycobacterium tuberculosis]